MAADELLSEGEGFDGEDEGFDGSMLDEAAYEDETVRILGRTRPRRGRTLRSARSGLAQGRRTVMVPQPRVTLRRRIVRRDAVPIGPGLRLRPRRHRWWIRRLLQAPPLPVHAVPSWPIAPPLAVTVAPAPTSAAAADVLMTDDGGAVLGDADAGDAAAGGADADDAGGAGGADGEEAELGGAALTDRVLQRADDGRRYGEPSRFKNPPTTDKRCGGKVIPCPVLVDMEAIRKLDGVSFEYIGGGDKKPGIAKDPATRRWRVVDANRGRNRRIEITRRGAAGLATFIANARAAGLPLEAILTMGSVNCRCISGTDRLSDHSYGDAIDIGGVRLVGGREVLVANAWLDPESRTVLELLNACARLSFARVLDYHDRKRHWDHFHCDTNRGGGRTRRPSWPFVREMLGLPAAGGYDRACQAALRELGPIDDGVSLDRTLSTLFMRVAMRRWGAVRR